VNKAVYAMLAASLLSTGLPAASSAKFDSCDTDHWGWGSSHSAECTVYCNAGSSLYVQVTNSDPDNNIRVEGSFDCSGGLVRCEGTQTCQDNAPGAVKYYAPGTCRGTAYEAWDSGTTVYCQSYPPGSGTVDKAAIFFGPSVIGMICKDNMACELVLPECVEEVDDLTCWI